MEEILKELNLNVLGFDFSIEDARIGLLYIRERERERKVNT